MGFSLCVFHRNKPGVYNLQFKIDGKSDPIVFWIQCSGQSIWSKLFTFITSPIFLPLWLEKKLTWSDGCQSFVATTKL